MHSVPLLTDTVGKNNKQLLPARAHLRTKRIRIFMQMQNPQLQLKREHTTKQNINCFTYIYLYNLNCRQAYSNNNSGSSRSTFNEFVLSSRAAFCSLFYTQNLICTRVHFVFNSQGSLAVNGLSVGGGVCVRGAWLATQLAHSCAVNFAAASAAAANAV